MDAIQFCYFLQGFLEVQNPRVIEQPQLQEIKNHLDLVLDRQTVRVPSHSDPKGPQKPDNRGFLPITGTIKLCGSDDYMKKEYCGVSWSPWQYTGNTPPIEVNSSGTIQMTISGVNLGYFGKSQQDKENEQIYITVTNKPIWSNKSNYSYYTTDGVVHGFSGYHTPDRAHASSFLDNFNVKQNNKKTYVLIDNDLSPKPTDYDNLKVYKPNHLIMAGKTCGILNVGTVPDSEILAC